MPEPGWPGSAGGPGVEILAGAIRDSGLVDPGAGGVVLLSGGPDSSALLLGLASLMSPSRLVALHLNYRLRPDSGRDEEMARLLAGRLGIEFVVEWPERESGNVHDWARRMRYEAAERLRRERNLDWVAVAHTMTDRAETVLYRLAVSPGARAFAAMPSRQGKVIRPIISLEREAVHRAATEAGLSWVEDPSNLDPGFARTRIREEVLPVLRDINRAAVANLDRTRAEVAGQLETLSGIAASAMIEDELGLPALEIDTVSGMEPPLARQAIRVLVEERLGRPAAVREEDVRQTVDLARKPGGGEVQLPGGVSLRVEGGLVIAEMTGSDEPAPEELPLDLPGQVSWGGWTIASEVAEPPVDPGGPQLATLDAAAVGSLAVRAWQEGDRMRPLGLGGSRTVQDLFTDAGLRRSLRRHHPLVVVDGEIAWIPGVALADPFRVTDATDRVVRLTAGRDRSAR